ncbi:hypothetical protein DS043_17445 [Escherichia coli]|nr:hypothetical protein [Escherichia coli]EFO4690222.1 hypothetical protein [Escherichia coli]EFO4699923.1 hypothetical protein [Escherichia coli]EFX8384397.1 hypothetical protein [Shigella dysenteriae]
MQYSLIIFSIIPHQVSGKKRFIQLQALKSVFMVARFINAFPVCTGCMAGFVLGDKRFHLYYRCR